MKNILKFCMYTLETCSALLQGASIHINTGLEEMNKKYNTMTSNGLHVNHIISIAKEKEMYCTPFSSYVSPSHGLMHKSHICYELAKSAERSSEC